MYDVKEILERTDLLALVESDLGPGKKSGRWYLFHCPFPGHAHGDRRESLTITVDNGRFYCFACRKSGDALTWLTEYRGLDFKAACEFAGGNLLPIATPRPVLHPQDPPVKPPPENWQLHAAEFCTQCQENLWAPSGEKALAYLVGRGLTHDAIQMYQLGLNPQDCNDQPATWDLTGEDAAKPVWIPKGITIPAYVGTNIWYVNIRRPTGEPKYFKIRGSRRALYGADNLVHQAYGLLVEGEIDCITADQEIGRLIGVATMGSATNRLDLAAWGAYLMCLEQVLVAYDADTAGEAGGAFLAGLGGKVRRVKLPGSSKDINAYHAAGGNLTGWIVDQLAALPEG
jgi:DNA primase